MAVAATAVGAWLYRWVWSDFGLPVWPNLAAAPICAAAAAVAAFLFRDHIGRALSGWWHRHFGHRAELAEIKASVAESRDLAVRAHRIAADLYHEATGERHPDDHGGHVVEQ